MGRRKLEDLTIRLANSLSIHKVMLVDGAHLGEGTAWWNEIASQVVVGSLNFTVQEMNEPARLVGTELHLPLYMALKQVKM
jgi:hypothetical protein